MKEIKENISLCELTKLKQQHKFLLKELNVVPASPLPTVVVSKASNGMGKPPGHPLSNSPDSILIGDNSNSYTPLFFLFLKYLIKMYITTW